MKKDGSEKLITSKVFVGAQKEYLPLPRVICRCGHRAKQTSESWLKLKLKRWFRL